MSASSVGRAILVGAVLVGFGSTCKTFHPAPVIPASGSERILITEAMIARSGGQTAWEVLRREVPQMSYGENRNGQATGIEHRGRSSIMLTDHPLLFIDGVRIQELITLQQLPASTVLSIEVLTGSEGTTYYGTDAVGGVIVVRTKRGGGGD
jgi:outer membrane cobalamin receptor